MAGGPHESSVMADMDNLCERLGTASNVCGADLYVCSQSFQMEINMKEIEEQAKRAFNATKFPGLDWAHKLKVKHAMGERLSPAQITLYQEALNRSNYSGD